MKCKGMSFDGTIAQFWAFRFEDFSFRLEWAQSVTLAGNDQVSL